ncbi:MAG: hypothetical protein PSX36_06290 [bacterium]|nr:hypothetical protein [bacterium]
MRIISFLVIALIIAIPFSSCEKEYFKPVQVDPNVPVSYKTDVEPLWAAKCMGSGCHGGSVPPNLSVGKSYASLIEGLYVDTLNPAASLLMIKLNKDMPPGGLLPQPDRDKVQNWIKQGAKDN